ncbi:MAG: glycosyltransferase [Oscillospiraceae bacterium]
MNILVTLNSDYLPQLKVMLTSLAVSNPNDSFDIYVAHNSLTIDEINNLKKLEKKHFIKIISIQIKDNFLENAPITGRYPREMYYRIFAAQFLPAELDKILYLDPDIVVINDISPLYNLELGTCVLRNILNIH